MTFDATGRVGRTAFRPSGPGLPFTRMCAPCGKPSNAQNGGGMHLYAGLKTWYCLSCNEKWKARQAKAAK